MDSRVTLLLVALAAPARADDLLYFHCPHPGGEYLAEVDGEVRLAREFLGPNESAAVDESIRQQLRYIWGWYRNDPASHAALQVTLAARPPEITIVSRTETTYGRSLALPWQHTEQHLAIEDEYTRRAVARGHVDATQPALVIRYRAKLPMVVCGQKAAPPSSLRAPLPPDPWLAYWMVPLAKHRWLAYFRDRAFTNPCADDDFADLPHPFYYWYDWQPDRHTPDADGRRFDCRTLLHDQRDFFWRTIRLGPPTTASGDFRAFRAALLGEKPLGITLFIGALDHDVLDLQLPKLRDLLTGLAELPARLRAAHDWWISGRAERGTGIYLATLTALAGVMTFDQDSVTTDGKTMLVEISGRLRKSSRAVRVRLHLSMTDVFGKIPPPHFAALHRAMLEDELVFYYGHSGIGENLRLSRIADSVHQTRAEFLDALKRSPLRLVAILSCYSYMYYGPDLPSGRLFILAGHPPPLPGERGPVALFELIDAVLASPDGNPGKLSTLKTDEFWIMKHL